MMLWKDSAIEQSIINYQDSSAFFGITINSTIILHERSETINSVIEDFL